MACVNRALPDLVRCSFCLLGQACPWGYGGPLDLSRIPDEILIRGPFPWLSRMRTTESSP